MAFKVSKKQIKEQGGITIAFGYCQIQRLLRPYNPTAFCAGVYGWMCDFYANIAGVPINIVTGYDTSRCGAVDLPDDLLNKFKELESEVYSTDLDEIRIKFKELLTETHKRIAN